MLSYISLKVYTNFGTLPYKPFLREYVLCQELHIVLFDHRIVRKQDLLKIFGGIIAMYRLSCQLIHPWNRISM